MCRLNDDKSIHRIFWTAIKLKLKKIWRSRSNGHIRINVGQNGVFFSSEHREQLRNSFCTILPVVVYVPFFLYLGQRYRTEINRRRKWSWSWEFIQLLPRNGCRVRFASGWFRMRSIYFSFLYYFLRFSYEASHYVYFWLDQDILIRTIWSGPFDQSPLRAYSSRKHGTSIKIEFLAFPIWINSRKLFLLHQPVSR